MVSQVSLVVLVLSCTFVAVFATKACYRCNSHTDRDYTPCVDPMSPYPYVNYTYCPDSYVCTRVSYITQKQYVVSRGCDPPGDTCSNIYKSFYSYYPDIASFNCYYCSGNHCNSASGLTHSDELKEIQLMEHEIPLQVRKQHAPSVNVV